MSAFRRERPVSRRGADRNPPQVRTIRSDEVRYPGATLPPLPDELQERYRAACAAEGDGPGPLTAGVRDTGIAVEGRIARQQRAKRKAAQRTGLIAALAIAGLLLVAIGWRTASDRRAATAPLGGGASAAVAATQGALGAMGIATASGDGGSGATPASSQPTAGPTPIFASYKKVKLHLPLRVKSLTEVGFHQASYSYALPMKTPLPDAKLSKAGNHKGTGRDASEQPTGTEAVLIGKVLRMWRPRPGRPDTAADVGGKPGAAVYAPVTGTVVKVKKYKLYGKWDDYEIHIQPSGHPELDVVMIHVQKVTCRPGDSVSGGETRIAALRKISDKFYVQLASYTKGGGNHVHVQVNDATDPTYKGLKGAITPQAADDGGASSGQTATPEHPAAQ